MSSQALSIALSPAIKFDIQGLSSKQALIACRGQLPSRSQTGTRGCGCKRDGHFFTSCAAGVGWLVVDKKDTMGRVEAGGKWRGLLNICTWVDGMARCMDDERWR